MTETSANKGAQINGPAPDSTPAQRHAVDSEAGALAARLKAIIGEESVSSFARRCRLAESVLRTYLRDGRMPPLDKASVIAAAAGVSVDWLATGRGARVAAQGSAEYRIDGLATTTSPRALALDTSLLERIVKTVLQEQGAQASAEQVAAIIVDRYQRALDRRAP
ncbi:MAG: hypothetical protein IAE88_11570 [Rhodobacteraceae bacterium]|uniref:hypothetical protein n=1 Tax=Accumulibacter sp. TaxID=2053492 RepID=UPI0019DB0998|nr:hypothetical protein [Accumulibacter sp.]MBE2259491.1 hypothetical protein [Paracoccaceae bacterium]